MRLGPILLSWGEKKASSNRDVWLIDESPDGIEEAWHFENPLEYISPEDTRNILENRDYSQDIQGKRDFREFATKVGGRWAFMLGLLIFAQGCEFIPFKLEPEEFIAVVSTTTASIFGITYVVGRYLYGSKAYASKTNSDDSVTTN